MTVTKISYLFNVLNLIGKEWYGEKAAPED